MIADTQKQILISTWETLGVPLEPSKLEGPTTCLTFLGIDVALQVRIPEDKLMSPWRELAQVVERKVISKKGLHVFFNLQPKWFGQVDHFSGDCMLCRRWALIPCITYNSIRRHRQTSYGGTCLWRNGMVFQCYGIYTSTH